MNSQPSTYLKNITVLYFAVFREKSGTSQANVKTAAASALDLYAELSEMHNFPLDPHTVRAAVNDKMSDWNTKLEDGDTVAFLAPFGGG